MSNILGLFLSLLFSIWWVVVLLITRSLLSYLVNRFVTEQEGKILEYHFVGLRSGKYPSKGDFIYRVRFLDKSGCEHKAYIRISFITGVSIEEDQIIKSIENK